MLVPKLAYNTRHRSSTKRSQWLVNVYKTSSNDAVAAIELDSLQSNVYGLGHAIAGDLNGLDRATEIRFRPDGRCLVIARHIASLTISVQVVDAHNGALVQHSTIVENAVGHGMNISFRLSAGGAFVATCMKQYFNTSADRGVAIYNMTGQHLMQLGKMQLPRHYSFTDQYVFLQSLSGSRQAWDLGTQQAALGGRPVHDFRQLPRQCDGYFYTVPHPDEIFPTVSIISCHREQMASFLHAQPASPSGYSRDSFSLSPDFTKRAISRRSSRGTTFVNDCSTHEELAQVPDLPRLAYNETWSMEWSPDSRHLALFRVSPYAVTSSGRLWILETCTWKLAELVSTGSGICSVM